MNDMKSCLFDAYCEYTEEKQLEYQKTEQYQELQRQLDENKRAIDRLISNNPELKELYNFHLPLQKAQNRFQVLRENQEI